MNNQSDYSKLVLRYLMREMDRDEIASFEKRLITDPRLKSELMLQKNIDHSIKNDDLENFKKELDSIYNESNGKKTLKLGSTSKQWLQIAAGIVLVLSVATILYYNSLHSSSSLFDKYYQPYENVLTTRGDINTINQSQFFSEALRNYHKEDYIEAKQLFEKVILLKDDDMLAHLYYGIVCLEMNLFEEAERNFKLIINEQDQFFKQQAQWYLALTYLKNDRLRLCSTQLEGIIENKGYNYKKAGELLSSLE